VSNEDGSSALHNQSGTVVREVLATYLRIKGAGEGPDTAPVGGEVTRYSVCAVTRRVCRRADRNGFDGEFGSPISTARFPAADETDAGRGFSNEPVAASTWSRESCPGNCIDSRVIDRLRDELRRECRGTEARRGFCKTMVRNRCQ